MRKRNSGAQVRPWGGPAQLLALLALATGLSTCGPGHGDDCLTRTGDVITQRRELPSGLRTITAYDNVDLVLVQDTETYAEVRAGENLIDDIALTLDGNSLSIANTMRCNWARSYDTPREVRLHLPHLKSVFLRGAGNISTAGVFREDSIYIHLVGAGDYNLELRSLYLGMDMYELGDMTLRGQAEELNMTLGGNGRLFADGLQTQRCFFFASRDHNGNAFVRAATTLGGNLNGNGSLFYAGNPTVVDVRELGRGRVVKAD